MSDDAQQYFNAWKGVFGAKGTTKLLCAWHVDRAWRSALHEHVSNKQTRVKIYHQLMENKESAFRLLLQQFISFLDDNEKRFCKYFKDNYCNRLEQWASYFRIGTVINTNMFVEAFHRTLKIVYLQQKQNRRIDFLLHTLLKLARDKVFERLTKLEKGKYSHRISEINKRHKSAERMLPMSVNIIRDDIDWIVPSEKDASVRYNVRLINETCDCKLRCSSCEVCVHMYSCTCMDSTLHKTVCKHVHLVTMTTTTTTTTDKVCDSTSMAATSLEYFSNLLKDKVKDSQLSTLRQQVLNKLDVMAVHVRECQSKDALKTSIKHITSALMTIKAIESTSEPQPTLPLKGNSLLTKTLKNSYVFFQPKRSNSELHSG